MGINHVKKLIPLLAVLLVNVILFTSDRVSRSLDRYSAIAPAVLAAIISAGGVAAAAGVNAASNAYTNRQNQKNWETQNEYNSPVQQVGRYRKAGLNPNLIYGSGQASAGNAGALPAYEGTHVSTGDVLQMATAIGNIKSLDANTRKAEAEALGTMLENQSKVTALKYQDTALDLDNKMKFADIAYRNGLIGQLGYQQAVLTAQAEKLAADAAFSNYRRTTLEPALLSIKRQAIANETAYNKSRLESMFTERVGARTRNAMLQFEKEHQGKDWLLNRRSKALGAASGALGSLVGAGRLWDDIQFRHSWWNY